MTCDKIQYDSHGDAMRQVPHLNDKKHSKKHKYRAYLCECGKWHITTITKNQARPQKKQKYRYRYEGKHNQLTRIKRKSKKFGNP
jgi:hypothetical protein